MSHLGRAGATNDLYFLEFSGDGRRLFSGSTDSVRMWDASTGEPLAPPLKMDQPVYWCSLRPDGNQVATLSQSQSPVLWNLATGQRSAADWLALARLQSRFDVDETGTLEAMADEDVMQLWDELKQRFPQDANTPLPQLADWQVQEALRLGGRGLHGDAADAMQKAAMATPGRADLQGGLCVLYGKANLWDETMVAADRAIDLDVQSADVYWYRGWAKAVVEDWEAAHRDFATACAADPKNLWRHAKWAVATYAAGDIEAFKPMVAADGIAALLGDVPGPLTLNSVAWHMLFTPHGDSARAQVLVEKALEPEPEFANLLNTLALAYYRAEKYEEAVELTTRLTQSDKIDPMDLLFLAMAQHRLGKVEEAQAAWKKAESMLDEADRRSELDPSLRLAWAIRFCNKALRAEAAALIGDGGR
jgi:tetratricopeptide (TPR) repeat protein